MSYNMKPNTIIFNKILSFLQNYASLMHHRNLVHICMTSYSSMRNLEAIQIMRKYVCVFFNTLESASIADQLNEIVDIFRFGNNHRFPTFLGDFEELTPVLQQHLGDEALFSKFKALQGSIIETMMRLVSMSKHVHGLTLTPQPSGSHNSMLTQIGFCSKQRKHMTEQEIMKYTEALIWLNENVHNIGMVVKYVKQDEAAATHGGILLDAEGLTFILNPKNPQPTTMPGTSASTAPKEDTPKKADQKKKQ